ncbi:MAG: thermonuclease family protein, partial [Mesorhizobium sp.]
MSRSWSRWPRQRYYAPRPRSLWRRLMDYGLTLIVLGLLILLAARLDRVETRKTEGAAIVNDGDSITLGSERIRMRGIDAPEYSQICRKDGADYP